MPSNNNRLLRMLTYYYMALPCSINEHMVSNHTNKEQHKSKTIEM